MIALWLPLAAAGPDLIFDDITAQTGVRAGDRISIPYAVRNQGDAGSARPAQVQFRLSADDVWAETDTNLCIDDFPDLAAGGSIGGQADFCTIPMTAEGEWYVVGRADSRAGITEDDETNNTFAVALTVGPPRLPDLAWIDFDAPDTTRAGDSETIQATIENAGEVDSGPTRLVVRLSQDDIYDSTDSSLCTIFVDGLAPASSALVSGSCRVSEYTAEGDWFYVARLDGWDEEAEEDEGDDVRSQAVYVGPPRRPDLSFDRISAAGPVPAGEIVAASATVRNDGEADAGGFTVTFRLSDDPGYASQDTSLCTASVSALAAGATIDVAPSNCLIPESTPEGDKYVVARVDVYDSEQEEDEGNNDASATLTIGEALQPDLAWVTTTVPRNLAAGSTVTISYRAENLGDDDAPTSTTVFRLSANATYDSTDTLLCTTSLGALAAGAALDDDASCAIPSGTAAGAWYVVARLDAYTSVAEVDELNDVAVPVTVDPEPLPDLGVTLVTGPTWFAPGDAVAFTVRETNTGSAEAASHRVGIRFSDDETYDGSDELICSVTAPALALGATQDVIVACDSPTSLDEGEGWAIARADIYASVRELDEDNNDLTAPLIVATAPPGVDLGVEDLTLTTPAVAGSAITVAFSVTNLGQDPAVASVVELLWSADGARSADDLPLCAVPVPALPASSAQGMSPAGCVLPESTPTGAGFILVDVDAAGANSDVNPVNDLATATISVTAPPPKPNLVLGTLVSTRDARPGQLLEISYDVQNSGGSATPATVTRIWISDDTIPGPGDVVLCDDLIGALAPGQSSERSIGNCALSLLIAEGEWYLVAQVDADGQSAESLEIDNFDANALTISAGDTGTTDAPTDDATDLPEDDTDGSDIDVPDITNGPIGCSCATPAGTPWWPLALASGAAALRRRRVR